MVISRSRSKGQMSEIKGLPFYSCFFQSAFVKCMPMLDHFLKNVTLLGLPARVDSNYVT